MSAALQQPPAVPPQPQPAQNQNITPEMLMEMFAIGEEEAVRILQALPQLCGAAQPQIQQGAEIGAIQQGYDMQNFLNFMNLISSPIITDQERAYILQLDVDVLYEVSKNTSLLADARRFTADSVKSMVWSDKAKTMNAEEIAGWIMEVLIPQILEPMMQTQEQLTQGQELTAQKLMELAQLTAQQQAPQPTVQQPGAQPMNGTGPNPGQGIGMGGVPQGQRYPWKNSKGDSLWYKMFQDSTGKKTLMVDSLQMDIQKDSMKIDEDGVLTGDAIMTAAMVQTYMKDGKEQKVLKDPGELQKACDAWQVGLPCADQHPEDGLVMNQNEIVGWTTPPQWDTDNNCVRCKTSIFDKTSIKKIQDGKTDVSIGFFCDLDDSPGTFQDADYEAVQRNIVFNHLAIGLDKGNGRCPDGTCGIQSDEPRTEEERAMSHFNITPEAWAKLSAEEKAAKIKALPPRGTADETVMEGRYQLEPGRPDTHDHYVTLDAEGNGISTENDDHVHMVEAMKVQLAEGHSHGLLAQSSEEETPMTDEEKLKAEKDKAEKEAADKAAADKAAADKAAEEPKDKATSKDKADSTEEKPEEKDEASQYVADMIKAEHTKMVDTIMDHKPKQEREFYEKKSLDELKELIEFLDSVIPEETSIPAGKRQPSDSTKAIDDAYGAVQEKIRTQ